MLISTALSLASLGSKAISGISNAIKMKKEKKNIQNQMDSLDAWYNANENQDYLDTEQSQNILGKLRDSMKKNNEIAANTSEVMGGTEEANLANKEADNKALSDTMIGLGEQATAHKDELTKEYQGQKNDLNKQMSELNKEQIQSSVNAGQNAMGAFGAVTNANAAGAFGNRKLFDFLRQKNEMNTAEKAGKIVGSSIGLGF